MFVNWICGWNCNMINTIFPEKRIAIWFSGMHFLCIIVKVNLWKCSTSSDTLEDADNQNSGKSRKTCSALTIKESSPSLQPKHGQIILLLPEAERRILKTKTISFGLMNSRASSISSGGHTAIPCFHNAKIKNYQTSFCDREKRWKAREDRPKTLSLITFSPLNFRECALASCRWSESLIRWATGEPGQLNPEIPVAVKEHSKFERFFWPWSLFQLNFVLIACYVWAKKRENDLWKNRNNFLGYSGHSNTVSLHLMIKC